MSGVSDERIAEMLAGLEGVTPGPWKSYPKTPYIARDPGPYPGDSYGSVQVGECGNWRDTELVPFNMERWMADAAHIARCDPDTMRSILTELQQARQKLLAAEQALGKMGCPRPCDHRPDELTVADCVGFGECGCVAHVLTTLKAQGITKPDDGRDHAQNTTSQAQDSQNVSAQNSQKAWPQDEALSVLENNCWDLRCTTTATDEAGCSDVHWVVIGHFVSHPQEREMGFGDTPIEAIRDAVRQKIGEPDLPSEFK